MNWGKAKSILIVALALTNLLLIGIYGLQYARNQHQDDNLYEYTVSLLEENNVYLGNIEIPEKAGKMSSLTVAYDTFDSEAMDARILSGNYGQPQGTSDDEIIYYCDKILSESELMNDNVVCEGLKSDGAHTEVIYENYYENIPVEECEMKFIFENGSFTGFERKWIDVVEEGNTKKDTISPISALLIFQNTINITEPVNIDSIKIVYLLESYDIQGELPISDTAFPAWQIKYSGGTVIYISAFEQ